MTTKSTQRVPPRKGTGRMTAVLRNRSWKAEGEFLDDESCLRGLANDTPFRVAGAGSKTYVQIDVLEG